MPRETKFTVYLMLFLSVAFGFVVWQKLSQKTDVLAELKKHAGEWSRGAFGPPAQSPDMKTASNENPFDARPLDHGIQQTGHEPRKLPVPENARRSSQNPFEETPGAGQGNKNRSPFEEQQEPPVKTAQNPFPPAQFNGATNTPNPKNPFPPQQNPSPQQTAQNNQNPAPAGQNPFDANPGGAFPQARPPVQTAQANSPQTNPFDGKGGTQNPPGNASPFEQPIQTTPPPNGFNPFDGDTNLVPVKHAEKPKPNPSAQNLFPDQNPSPPLGAFPSGNGQPDGKNPFDEFKTAQKPPGDSSVVPAPKFHSPGPAEQPENKGGFNPFDNNPLPPRPPQGGFPAPQQNQNPPAQPPHQHHPTPNPNPGNGPAYDPFQQTPLAAPSQKPTRAYKVQLDETYWSISEKLYGSIRYFQALAEFNRYRIANPKHLRAGMIILVPEPDELERLYANLIPGAKKSNDPYAAHDTGFFYTKAGAPMYRVGDDDTLSTIAQNYLGRSTRWVEIYNLNKDTLKTADKVKTGMVLKLPRDASRVAIDHSYSEVR